MKTYTGKLINIVNAAPVPLRSLLQSGRTSQTVTVASKNILDLTKLTLDYDGSITVNEISANKISLTDSRASVPAFNYRSYWLKNLVAGATYTVSGTVSGNGIPYSYPLRVDEYDASGTRTKTALITFTALSGYKYLLRLYINYSSSAIVGPVTMVFDKSQLELGSTATAYAPFVPNSPSPDYPSPIAGVTKTTVNSVDYAIPQTLYDGDSYDHVSGMGQATKGKATFIGAAGENWNQYTSGTNTCYFYTNPNYSRNGNVVCDKFPTLADPHDDTEGTINYYNQIIVRIKKNRLTTQDVSGFKSWLSSNPVTVLYQLSTPTAITGTPQSIPVRFPFTQISNDGGGDMTATVQEWEEFITDRTQSDIDNRTTKAYLNATDLNRIESNCSYLATALGVTITVKTNWMRVDSVTPSQISRLLGNIKALRQAYYTYPTTPDTPDGILHWEKLNAAEQISLDLYTLYGDNDAAKYYAGELYSGETMGVI